MTAQRPIDAKQHPSKNTRQNFLKKRQPSKTRQAPFNMARFFQALGDNTRLRLLNLMGDKEICVCYFVEVLRQPQPKISRHLAYLRSAGIVEARRQGKWMHYHRVIPADHGAAKTLQQTLSWLESDRSMQADRARLAKVCCNPSACASLDGAPLPAQIVPHAAITASTSASSSASR